MPDKPREKCGVFGVYSPVNKSVAHLVYKGLLALQHRGQDSSGIVISNDSVINTRRGYGLVKDIYDSKELASLPGRFALGHVRYATDGGSDHIQPVYDPELQLAHNGNLENVTRLVNFLVSVQVPVSGKNDSELMHAAILYYLQRGADLKDAVLECFPLFEGSFSLILMTKNQIAALRDKCGIRPLCIGELDGGIVFSSETVGLDAVGAKFIRDINPGEMFIVGDNERKSIQLAQGQSQLDVFEIIYFSHPNSYLFGQKVYDIRVNIGRELAKEYKIKADFISGIPSSGNAFGIGYSEVSHIPYHQFILKNPNYSKSGYPERTFILSEDKRIAAAKRKYILDPNFNFKGAKLAVVDDSIVRGVTDIIVVDLLRQNGTKEIYVASGAPEYRYTDKLGIATHSQDELIAHNRSVDEMRTYFKADGLGFISIEGLIRAIGAGREKLSFHVFDGIYPNYKNTGNFDKIPATI